MKAALLDSKKGPSKKSPNPRNKALNVKASAAERMLIEDAARQEKLELSSYIRRSLIKQAELDLSIRQKFEVSEECMEEFMAVLNRPVQTKDNLKKLLTEDIRIE